MRFIQIACILFDLYAKFSQKINSFVTPYALIFCIRIQKNHLPYTRSIDQSATRQTRRKGNIEGTALNLGPIFYGIQYRILFCMQSQGTTSFRIARTPFIRPFFITIMCSCRRTIIPYGNDPGIFGKYCTYMSFNTVRTSGQIIGQLHINIIKLRSFHNLCIQFT